MREQVRDADFWKARAERLEREVERLKAENLRLTVRCIEVREPAHSDGYECGEGRT